MIDAIRKADHFLASLFLGVGTYEKAKAKTVREALEAGALLVAQRRGCNARPIYYAVAKDGRATMLTSALINRLMALPVG